MSIILMAFEIISLSARSSYYVSFYSFMCAYLKEIELITW